MHQLKLLVVLVVFAGCSRQNVNSFVLVSESVPLSAEHFGAQALPRYIPEGTQYEVPAVGFEASDGSFYPVLALCNPIPRGGSVEPVRLVDRRLKVFQGSDPIAVNNELLAVYEIDSAVGEVHIAFSLSQEGHLNLAVTDPASGEKLAIRPLSTTAAASSPVDATLRSQASTNANQPMQEWGDDKVVSLGPPHVAVR